MSEEIKAKKKFNPIILILILIILALLGGGAYLGVKYAESLNTKEETGIKQDPNVFLNDEDAEEYLKDKVSSINVNMYRTIKCRRDENGKLFGKVGLENNNAHQYMVQFVLADTGEVIYTTGLIPPEGKLEEIPVEMDFEPGTYSVNAMFSVISEKDNQTSLGSSGVNLNMIVE